MNDPKERLVRIMGTFDLATGHADTLDELLDSLESELRDVLGHYRTAREWVGLTDEEITEIRLQTFDVIATNQEVYRVIEAKLKERNT